MRLDLDKVQANVQKATTEDLLDRATVYREGMEPEALALIEVELGRRGIGRMELEAHEQRRRETMLMGSDGLPVKCRKCPRPAVVQDWGWHWLWGVVPIFPRWLASCEEHRPV